MLDIIFTIIGWIIFLAPVFCIYQILEKADNSNKLVYMSILLFLCCSIIGLTTSFMLRDQIKKNCNETLSSLQNQLNSAKIDDSGIDFGYLSRRCLQDIVD